MHVVATLFTPSCGWSTKLGSNSNMVQFVGSVLTNNVWCIEGQIWHPPTTQTFKEWRNNLHPYTNLCPTSHSATIHLSHFIVLWPLVITITQIQHDHNKLQLDQRKEVKTLDFHDAWRYGQHNSYWPLELEIITPSLLCPWVRPW